MRDCPYVDIKHPNLGVRCKDILYSYRYGCGVPRATAGGSSNTSLKLMRYSSGVEILLVLTSKVAYARDYYKKYQLQGNRFVRQLDKVLSLRLLVKILLQSVFTLIIKL